jgi:hypothetical protein
LSYDVDSRDDSNKDRRPGRAERQCLLDIDAAGVRRIKEFQARQRRLRGKMEGARERRRRGGGGDGGPILGKGRSTSQHNFPGGPMRKMADGTTDADGMLLLPYLDARFVFIALPSIDVLRERLMKRGTELLEG